jgi:hypothetical protein
MINERWQKSNQAVAKDLSLEVPTQTEGNDS